MATDLTSVLDEAFSAHACSTMVAMGAIGAGLVSAGAFPFAALSLGSAAVAAKKCLDAPIPPLPGAGIPILGGRCATNYNVRIRQRIVNVDSCAVVLDTTTVVPVAGPVSVETVKTGVTAGTSCGGSPRRVDQFQTFLRNGSGASVADLTYYALPPAGQEVLSIVRADGQPDNCGNAPIAPYPKPPTPYPPIQRDPSGNPILPGNTYNISFQPVVNLPPVFIPVTFAPVVVLPSITFPIFFRVSIGSIEVGKIMLNIAGNITIDLDGKNADPNREKDYDKLLKQIKDCACALPPEPPELEVLSVPVVLPEDPDCDLSFVDLLVLKGSVNPNDAIKLAQSADLARQGCEAGTPPQEPESEIFSATSTLLNHEFVSPAIPPEVYSVRLRISSFGPAPIPVLSFPGASQYKFGSISWCGPLSSGAGEPVLVFDQDTYMVLPPRHLTGKVRVLVKEGVTFTLFDTGERV